MKPLTSFLPVLLVCLCSACQKEKFEDTTIQGKVLTYGTDEAIRHPPVRVVIYEEKEVGTWGSSNTYSVVAESMSKEDGSFELSHSLSNRKNYFVGVDENTVNNRHYIWPTYQNLERHKIHGRGGTQKMHYYLVARGWVKFHFTNQNTGSIQRFAYNFGAGAYEEFFGSFNIERTWDFAGNTTHTLYFGTTSNGLDSLWNEEIEVPAFDTINYQLHF